MTRITNRLRCSVAAAAFLAGLSALPSVAAAQAAPGGDAVPPTGADSAGNDEIIVTARKREERLQDVPETVHAFTEQAIADAGIEEVGDALTLVPNAQIFADQQPGVQTVTIRGISQSRGADSEQGFAFVVDGVTSPTIFSLTQDLYDIERIEILKGPQGALYGRNAIGGAINVITQQPTNDFQLGVNAGYAQGNEIRLGGRVSGALVPDRVLFRIAGSYTDFDGQIENVFLNRKVDFQREFSLRGQLELIPTDSLNISLRASHVNTDGGSTYNIATNAGSFGAIPGRIQEDHLGFAGRELTDLSMRVTWDLPFARLTSISAYTDVSTDLDQDLDFTSVSVAEALQFVSLDALMQELRLSSTGTGPFSWQFGAFYQRTNRDIRTVVEINANGPLGALVGGPGGTGNPASRDIRIRADRTPMWRFDSYAVFGMADYQISDQLKVSAGFRYDIEHRTFAQAGAQVSAGERTFREFQPTASLSYKPAPNVMLYATYATGFRPGGFNPFIGFSPDGTYDEETTRNYEVGIKSDLFDNRLRLNLSGFVIRSRGLQQRLLNLTTGQAEFFNIGNATFRGFEIEALARPASGLRLEGAVGFTDSEITSINPRITNVGGINPVTFIGNEAPRLNRYTLTLAGQYEAPVGNEISLMGRVEFRRTGRAFWYLDNTDAEPAYNTVDARLSLRSERRWSITAYVDNLFDEEWRVTFNNTRFEGLLGGINIAWPSPPRQIGLRLSYEFF